MRMTQIIGLSPQANAFLNENQKWIEINCSCPHCISKHVKHPIFESYQDASTAGMFDDGPALHKYQLKDDTWVYEYIQASPWSSGPCIFIALATVPALNPFHVPAGNEIKETLWSEEEINNA